MRRSVLLALVVASALRASSVTSASCTLGATTVTSATSCYLRYPEGFIYANAYATIQPIEPHNLVYPFPNLAAITGTSLGVNPEQTWGVNASAEWTKTFTTPGPPRDGVLFLEMTAEAQLSGFASASFGPYSCSVIGLSPACDIGIGEEGLLPLRLGTPFTVSLLATASDYGDAGSSVDAFLLYEADGTTPVPLIVVPTPEPSTFGLLLVSVLVCCGMVARRRLPN